MGAILCTPVFLPLCCFLLSLLVTATFLCESSYIYGCGLVEDYAEEKKEHEGAEEAKTAEFPHFVGQQLDVLDDVNRWSEAEVLQVKFVA